MWSCQWKGSCRPMQLYGRPWRILLSHSFSFVGCRGCCTSKRVYDSDTKKAYWALPASINEVPYAPIRDINFQGKSSMLNTWRKLRMPPDEQTLQSPVFCEFATSIVLSELSLTLSSHAPQLSHPTQSYEAAQNPKKVIEPSTPLEIQSWYSSLSSQSKSKPCILSLVKDYSSSFVPKSLFTTNTLIYVWCKLPRHELHRVTGCFS